MVTVLLLIASYKRPAPLGRCLESVAQLEIPKGILLKVIVGDNDPAGSAREVVSGFEGYDYLLVPERGIPSVRNSLVEHALTYESSWIGFIDDDETVPTHWLAAMFAGLDALERADVLTGPLRPCLEQDPESSLSSWIWSAGFFRWTSAPDGSHRETAATNNVLVSRQTIDSSRRPLFDPSFAASGGSDTDYFRYLTRNGAVIIWRELAYVWDWIPLTRLSIRWVARRGIRNGAVTTRTDSNYQGRSRVYIGFVGFLRIIGGIVVSFACLVTPGRSLTARTVWPVLRGVGMLRAAFKVSTVEYE